MRKNVLLRTALALALPLFGAVTAQAKETTKHHHPTKTWVATGHHWHKWGAAPFARTPAQADSSAKLDTFFTDASSASSPDPMPADVVAAFKQLIHDHPNGTITYITPGVTLSLMESADGPMYGVKVDELPVSFGVYKTAQVHAWAVRDGRGVTWQIGRPVICNNWMVFPMGHTIVLQAPPPAPPGCIALHIQAEPGDQIHLRDIALATLVADQCGPTLQEPGQALMQGNLPERPCDEWNFHQCTFENPAADARAGTEEPVTVRSFPVIDYTVTKGGDQVLYLTSQALVDKERHLITVCVTHHHHQSMAAVIQAHDFVNGSAYLTLLQPSDDSQAAPVNWSSQVYVHHMVYLQTKSSE
jgi:hypothetical protein